LVVVVHLDAGLGQEVLESFEILVAETEGCREEEVL
jgi:hypothetical protein